MSNGLEVRMKVSARDIANQDWHWVLELCVAQECHNISRLSGAEEYSVTNYLARYGPLESKLLLFRV